MSAALKLMENRQIFIELLCRNSHTGTTDTAEPQMLLVMGDFEKDTRHIISMQ